MSEKKTGTVVTSTQNALPVKFVKNKIIATTDGRFVKLIEVIPINFSLRSVSEQNGIYYSFRSLFKSGPRNMQFFTLSKKADINGYLRKLKEEMLEETSYRCLAMQKEYARLLINESREGGVSRRFFIAFEHERTGGIMRESFNEILSELNSTYSRISGCLVDCGNETRELDDYETIEVFYEILNRRKAEKLPFEQHRKIIEKKYIDSTGDSSPYVPIGDYIAPEYIEFIDPKRICIDGMYYTYLYIPAKGYNPVVYPGWTAAIINAGLGIDVSITFNKVDKNIVSGKVRRSITQNRASLSETSDAQESYESLNSALQSGLYIKNGMAQGEDFYYMFMLISICGDSPKALDWKVNEMKKYLKTRDMRAMTATFEMESAFKSMLPVCKTDTSLWNKGKRNMLTDGAASTYPFTSFEISDSDGIMLGRNMSNNTLAIVNIFNTKEYKNANMFIAGTTGAGKTFSLLLIAMRMRLKHIPVFIIAPEKEHEFERVCTAMDGQFIRFGSGSPHRINILDIRKVDDTASKLIDGGLIISSRLAEKVQDLKTFFKLLVPDMTYEEKELLDEALIRAYGKKGITMDNDSLYDPDNPDEYREMPVLGDLYDELGADPRALRLQTIINMLVSGSGSSFNGSTNVNLDNEFIVLGLEHLNDDLLPVGMFMAIDYVWSRIKEDRTKHKALFIDEWWRFAFDPLAADYSLKIAKTIRAYGGSLILATQQMTDIFAVENGKYGEGVLNNCKLKIIMQLEEADADKVQDILKLTETEKYKITRFKQGEALLVANSNNIMIKFQSNRTEFDLITTDPEELKKQLDQMSGEEKARRLNRREAEIEDVLMEIDARLEESDASGEDDDGPELLQHSQEEEDVLMPGSDLGEKVSRQAMLFEEAGGGYFLMPEENAAADVFLVPEEDNGDRDFLMPEGSGKTKQGKWRRIR